MTRQVGAVAESGQRPALHIRNNTGARRNAERTGASFYGEGADKYSRSDGEPVAAPIGQVVPGPLPKLLLY